MIETEYNYVIEDGELKVFGKTFKNIVWSGRPKELNVASFVKIPGSADCFVLLDWEASSKLQANNALRLTPLGEIVWEVSLPDKYKNPFGVSRENDVYIRIYEISNSLVSVNSYSGFLDRIDIKTGEVIDSIFVK